MLAILIKVKTKKKAYFCGFHLSGGTASCSAGGTPGEEVCRGLTAALPHVQLAPGSARALSHGWVRLCSGGREDDPCAGIPTWARTCRSGDASRALPGAWLCVKSRGGQGLSSSFPARLGLVTCAGGQILLWIPPSQRCRRSGGSREADPSGVLSHVQPSFISYQHCLGKAAMKQRPRTGTRRWRPCDAPAMCSSTSPWHLALVRGGRGAS